MSRLADRWKRFVQLYQKEIWHAGHLRGLSLRGALYAALRVISITATVFNETKAASRAAALSFSSLLGLGPLVALTVLIAGFALDKNDPNLAANTLSRLINFVAPQVGQYSKLDEHRHRHRDPNDAQTPPSAMAGDRPSDASTQPSIPEPSNPEPRTQNSKSSATAPATGDQTPELRTRSSAAGTQNPKLRTQNPDLALPIRRSIGEPADFPLRTLSSELSALSSDFLRPAPESPPRPHDE